MRIRHKKLEKVAWLGMDTRMGGTYDLFEFLKIKLCAVFLWWLINY